MQVETLYIAINGGRLMDVETHSIELLRLQEANLATGVLSLIVRRAPSEAALINDGDTVAVYRGLSTGPRCVFIGVAMPVLMSVTGDDFGHIHTIKGPGFYLEQDFFRKTGPLPSQVATSSAMLNLLNTWVAAVHSTRLALPAVWPSTIPDTWWNEWPGVVGPTMSTIQRLLAHQATAAAYWDYSGRLPRMVFINRGDERVTPDWQTVESVSLTYRSDLQPASVELYQHTSPQSYLGDMQDVDPIYLANDSTTFWPAGATKGDFGSVAFQPALLLEMLPSGPAKRIYDLLNDVPWEGSIVVQETDVALSFHPGQTVNLAGCPSYNPAWATMDAVVQSVAYDFMQRKWTLAVGFHGGGPASARQRLYDMLRMRPWLQFFSRLFPHGVAMVAAPLAGAGSPATATVIPSGELQGTLQLQMAASGAVGNDLAKVTWSQALGSIPANVTVTPSNSAAITLGSVTITKATNNFTITKAGAVAGTLYEWAFVVTP